jgi:D-alanyl-D-alanine carboxypeptidase
MKRKNLLTLFCFLLWLSSGYAQTLDKAKLDQFLDKLAEKNKAMGTLAIVKDGKVLYNRSIGYSQINGPEKKSLTADTKYRIGSITKMFTATMIFQLVEEGKLKLTDNLNSFFPLVPSADKITIEQILAHRSGIHEVSSDADFRALRTKGLTKKEMLDFIYKAKLDFEPGTKYAYSSAGYFILASIVEKLTGKTYQEALMERITNKIGLKDTYTAVSNIDVSKKESFSYKYTRDWEQQIETHPSILFGSGSMVSTTADMSKFIQALFNLRLVSQNHLDLMMQRKLGMDTFTYNGKTAYGHTGGIDGFGAWLAYVPEEKLTVSYATNGKVFPVSDLIDGIFNIYWNKPFDIPTFESLAISTAVLDKYVGIYTNPAAPLKFTITRDGTKLYLQLTGQSIIPLEPIAENKFKIESPPINIDFDVEKKQMIIKRNGGERVFTKEN